MDGPPRPPANSPIFPASCLALDSAHNNVKIVECVITFANDKHFGLVDRAQGAGIDTTSQLGTARVSGRHVRIATWSLSLY
jgi:hypothetical protein